MAGTANAKPIGKPNWKGFGVVPSRFFTNSKRNASKRGIYFDITISDVDKQFASQGGICPYSGIELTFDSGGNVSIDRVDSNKGYVVENIQLVYKQLNIMKHINSENDFLRLCYLIANPVFYENTIVIYDKNPKWSGVGNMPKWFLGKLKDTAKRKKKKFDESIDCKYLWRLFEKQNGLCALTGIPIGLPKNSYLRKESTASLDRIDSSKGYEQGNLQWVHKDVNFMKNDLTNEELILICNNILKSSPKLKWLAEIA